ncbi:Tetratricopeptide repeat-like superfamily protein [Gossypium australe]|uniref:Tetratricopeptide repeat-like superfamily protein n=1 Tax=Gossypium australe TaxID=47621 RepID=A0A5B6UR61_9ROSI|nr:Tetratricopeptide repeat-like superfamily protein [Gossypium australe]
MVVEVAATARLQWSKPIPPQPPSSSQALVSATSSPSVLCLKSVRRSALFGAHSTTLQRTRCREFLYPRSRTLKRACSASLVDDFSDEEFSKKIQELAPKFQSPDDSDKPISEVNMKDLDSESLKPSWLERGEEIIPSNIERKANSVDIPLSLRIIKRKLQWQEGFRDAGESAYCSMKKAFSSMVFIIRELHSYTLQMRELLFYEDLQGVLVRVQKEMHASFVWLFQQVFSHTPTLMVYVMVLLANYSVHSMGSTAALAAVAAPSSPSASYVSVVEDQKHPKFDFSSIKSFSVTSSSGKTTSIGGNNGGGGKARPIASGTDGDGLFNAAEQFRTIVPDGASQLSSPGTTGESQTASSTSGRVTREEELSLWNTIVDEASNMQALFSDETIDNETIRSFISPVMAKMEPDDYHEDYLKTELFYKTELSQEPNNPLLLANYAQFLYLVVRDYDRAEEYFKKAIEVEPADGEAYSKYASFLWRVRKDLWAAEETLLGAISADPTNSYYSAYYAHFLWNTGGDDTCFPLTSPDTTQKEA